MIFGLFKRQVPQPSQPSKADNIPPRKQPEVQTQSDFLNCGTPAERADFLAKLPSRKMARQLIRELSCEETLSLLFSHSQADSGIRAEAQKQLKTLRSAVESDSALKALRKLESIAEEAVQKAASEAWYEAFPWLDKVREQWSIYAVNASASPRFSEIKNRFDAAQKHFQTRLEEQNHVREGRVLCEALCAEAEVLAALKEEALLNTSPDNLKARFDKRPELPGAFAKRFENRFNEAIAAFEKAKIHYLELLENRRQYEASVEAVVAEAEALCAALTLPSERQINDLRSRFEHAVKPIRGADADYKRRFNAAVEKVETLFAERRQSEESERAERKAQAEALCLELENLIHAEPLTLERIRALQSDVNRLIEAFHDLSPQPDKQTVNRFYKSEKTFLSERRNLFAAEDQERWVHYAAKLKLTEITELAVASLQEESIVAEVSGKLKEFRLEWKNLGAVPREMQEPLWERFNTACQTLHDWLSVRFAERDAQRADNLAVKTRLCEELEALSNEPQSKDNQQKFDALMNAWKNVGAPSAAEREALNERFKKALDAYFLKRDEHFKIVKAQRAQAREIKNELIAEALTLARLNWDEGIKRIQNLRNRWKEAGFAGKSDDDALWNAFNAAIQTFFDAESLHADENFKIKTQVCEALEAAAGADADAFNLKKADDTVREAIEKWRKTGPVPEAETEAILTRFKTALDRWHERRDSEYSTLNLQREEAQRAKESLIGQLEDTVKSALSEKEKAEKVKTIQAEWKLLPHTFREDEETLRTQFSNLCNAFFENRREQFDKLMTQRKENLDVKRLICAKLERLAERLPLSDEQLPDMNALAKELQFILADNITAARPESREEIVSEAIALQAQWRESGPVPREEADAVFQRYRRACDAVFGRGRSKTVSVQAAPQTPVTATPETDV